MKKLLIFVIILLGITGCSGKQNITPNQSAQPPGSGTEDPPPSTIGNPPVMSDPVEPQEPQEGPESGEGSNTQEGEEITVDEPVLPQIPPGYWVRQRPNGSNEWLFGKLGSGMPLFCGTESELYSFIATL